MKPLNPWQSYRQVATHTASPGQLVLMLFEGAIRFLEQARGGFELQDPAESNTRIHNNVTKAQEIIRELNYSLNLKEGGQLAATLQGLYLYLDRRLDESNRRKEPQGIIEVAERLTVLRDAWATMLSQANPASSLAAGELVAA
jgi:flagellar secretion chaperone FliS